MRRVDSLYSELNHTDIPLVVPSPLYICVMLCHRAITCRLGIALAQMVKMSALYWIWWTDDCWSVVGNIPMYIQVSHTVEPVATVGALRSTMLFMHWLQLFSSALVPCSVTLPMEMLHSYTLGIAPGYVTGQCLAAVGHSAPAPGCRSHASSCWRGMSHITLLLGPPQPSVSAKQVSPIPLRRPW